ncbi:Iron-sulfur cluster-binding protein [Brevinematales bacterium NS]|nr:Iron-sulfur cluster-binding protein [Brevinematales bacterium NS]
MSQVYGKRVLSYETKAVFQAVEDLFAQGNFLKILSQRGKRVLVKPNLLASQAPEKAVTTHPVVVEAVIRVLKDGGFDVEVGDSPAIEDMISVMKKTGLDEVLRRYGVRPANFKETVVVENPKGKLVRRFEVVRAFVENDMVISLPKLKTHTQMFYTGAIKNLFGLVQGLQKSRFHLQFPERERFARLIVDLYEMVNPVMSLMDAIVAMEGEGPQGGDPKEVGLLLASLDTLSLDVVAAELIGYQLDQIPILRQAVEDREKGYRESIRLEGVNWEEVKPDHFVLVKEVSDTGFIRERFPWLFVLARNLLVPRPVFLHEKCIRCGRCLQICSAEALSWKEKKGKKFVSINYQRCIRCFCCHEICPVEAIELRRKVW